MSTNHLANLAPEPAPCPGPVGRDPPPAAPGVALVGSEVALSSIEWQPPGGIRSAGDSLRTSIAWTVHRSKIFLHAPVGDDPCCPPGRVPTGRLWSEEVAGVVGDFKLGSDVNCSIDDSIPGRASFGFGGSFADGVDDPAGWLVCDGVESVSVAGACLLVEGGVVGEKVVSTVDGLGGSCHFELGLEFHQMGLQLCISDRAGPSPGIKGRGLRCCAAKGSDESGQPVGVLVG